MFIWIDLQCHNTLNDWILCESVIDYQVVSAEKEVCIISLNVPIMLDIIDSDHINRLFEESAFFFWQGIIQLHV